MSTCPNGRNLFLRVVLWYYKSNVEFQNRAGTSQPIHQFYCSHFFICAFFIPWFRPASSVFTENWCLYKMKQQGSVKSKKSKGKCRYSLARLERETTLTLNFQPLAWRENVFLLSGPPVLHSNQDWNVSSFYLKKSIATQVRLLWILQEWSEMQSVYCIPQVFPICVMKWMLEWKPCPWSRRQKEDNIWASYQLRKFHELKTLLISLVRI